MNAVTDGVLLIHSPICIIRVPTYSHHNIRNIIFIFFILFARFDAAEKTIYDRAVLKPPPHMQLRSELQQANDLLQNAAFLFLRSKFSLPVLRPVYFSVLVCVVHPDSLCIVQARKPTQQTHHCSHALFVLLKQR